MPGDPNSFGTDLGALWVAANRDLPRIAERYSKANQTLNSNSDDSAAFGHAAIISPAPTVGVRTTAPSRVFSHWDGLRDALQQALKMSSDYTFESAEALLRIMENYSATDGEAQQSMNKAITTARNGEFQNSAVPADQRDNQAEKTPIQDYDFNGRQRPVGRH